MYMLSNLLDLLLLLISYEYILSFREYIIIITINLCLINYFYITK